MTWSKSALPLDFTNWVRTASSATGDAVNRPVLMDFFSSTVLARACPAAIQAASDVALIAQAQAADLFFPAAATAKAVPPAMASGSPSSVLIGTAARDTSSLVLDSTLTYHCCAVWTATWSFTNWFLSPNTSQVSLKDLTLAKPPWASITCFNQVSALTLFESSRVGLPVSSLVPPPKTSNHMYAEPGRSGSKPSTDGLPPFCCASFSAAATIWSGLEVSSWSSETPPFSSTRLFAIRARGWKNCGTANTLPS